jgi:hypothetical protein
MTKLERCILAITGCALCSAIPLAAASKPAASKNAQTTKTSAVRSAWRQETLSGKIAMVDPSQKRVIVETPDQVTYSLVINAKTRIKSGNQALTLKDLTQDKNKTVSVRFTPERRGDVAKSIQISG